LRFSRKKRDPRAKACRVRKGQTETMGNSSKRLVVGISGASGVIYGLEMLKVLKDLGYETHVVMTAMARSNFLLETDHSPEEVEEAAGRIYDDADLAAPIASGSFITRGMVVIPCSIKSLSGIANSCHSERTAPPGSGGAGDALTQRAPEAYARCCLAGGGDSAPCILNINYSNDGVHETDRRGDWRSRQ
jgi:hypothetical protein